MEPIIVNQKFNVSKETLWKAITDKEQMRQWFFEQMNDFNAEIGFETKFIVNFNGLKFTHVWKIEEIIPHKKIVYNWRYKEYDGEARVKFELFDYGEKTILRLTNSVINAFPPNIEAFTRKSTEEGWRYFIKESLKIHLNQKSKFCYDYPRPMVCVDMIVLRKTETSNEILLIKRLNDPFKDHWALPGGFIEMEEDLIDSAYRELDEETHITQIQLKQLKTYGTPGRDPRGRTISVVFGGFLESKQEAQAGDDAKETQWFSLEELPPLAFDHQLIIQENQNL
jgi:8-oxo-dGTP diphosphatase